MNNQKATLSVYFTGPNPGGYNAPGNSIHYVTDSYEEIYKFKKICKEFPKESNILHTVRFKPVDVAKEKVDYSYANRAQGEGNNIAPLFNKVKDFFNRKVF